MTQLRLVCRLGDAGDYRTFDDLGALADDLAGHGVAGPLGPCVRYGVRAPGYGGHNYISLYPSPLRARATLTREERAPEK